MPRALVAALSLAAVLVAVGCASLSDREQSLTVRIQDTSGAAMAGLEVTVWVGDASVPVASRTAEEREAILTDARGQATWAVETEEKYICGYRVRDDQGSEILYAAPIVSERRNASSGILDLVI